MDAKQLFKEDGTSTFVWYCGKCGTLHKPTNRDETNQEAAERCCTHAVCELCGNPLSTPFGRFHSSCWERHLFETAEVVPDEGFEGYFDGDVFFEEWEELANSYRGRPIEERPSFVFATLKHYPDEVTLDDVLESMMDDLHEESRSQLRGTEELKVALSEFWKLNKEVHSLIRDTRKRVRVPADIWED